MPLSAAGDTFLGLVGSDSIVEDTVSAGGDLALAIATLSRDEVTGELSLDDLQLSTGGSSDPDGQPLTATWEVRAVGDNDATGVELSDSSGTDSTLSVSGPTVLAVTITLVTADGAEKPFVVLVWVDAPPVAAIGDDLPEYPARPPVGRFETVVVHAAGGDATVGVQLDGSRSYDPEGASIHGQWSVAEGSLLPRFPGAVDGASPVVGSPAETSLLGVLSGVPGGASVDVTLTVTTSDSAAGQDTAVVNVIVNALPTVHLDAPPIVFLRDPIVSFTATVAASTDADGTIDDVEWVLENGIGGGVIMVGEHTDTITVQNIQMPGELRVGATLTDSDGGVVWSELTLVDVRPCDATDTDGDGVADCYDECMTDPLKSEPLACGCGVSDTDSDGDGVPDCNDGCPSDPAKTEPLVCGCGTADSDSDSDGTLDCNDECPLDSNKVEPLGCGCGVADIDSDGDGTLDCNDECPLDSNKVEPLGCGCGAADIDSDGDGTLDCHDECPLDADKTEPLQCGCSVADHDLDGDGVANCIDACVTDANKAQDAGACGCGISDVDSDADGVADCIDWCPQDSGKVVPGTCGCGVPDTDSDGDGIADCLDYCPAGQVVTRHPQCGCGVALPLDSDGDGVPDCEDACPYSALKTTPGVCGCFVSDDDSDGDGVPDCNDGCPSDPLKVSPGGCGCGAVEADADGDGTLDCHDACPMDPHPDADGDGVCSEVDQCPDSELFGPANTAGCTLGDMCPCATREQDRHSFRACVRQAVRDNGFSSSWNSERKQRDACARVLDSSGSE